VKKIKWEKLPIKKQNQLDQAIEATTINNKIKAMMIAYRNSSIKFLVDTFSLVELRLMTLWQQDPVILSIIKRLPQMTQSVALMNQEINNEFGQELGKQVSLIDGLLDSDSSVSNSNSSNHDADING
jgi:hypothetical protein